MSYTRTTWSDGTTPVDASNMNNIEKALVDQDSRIDAQDILSLGTAINSGDDLNDYTTVGRYNSASSSISGSLSNTPVSGVGFALFVFRAGARYVQLLVIAGTMTATTGTWMYIRNVSGTTWTNWYGISGTRIDE